MAACNLSCKQAWNGGLGMRETERDRERERLRRRTKQIYALSYVFLRMCVATCGAFV